MAGIDRLLLFVVACTVVSGIAYLVLASGDSGSPRASTTTEDTSFVPDEPVSSVVPPSEAASTSTPAAPTVERPPNEQASTLTDEGADTATREIPLETWRLGMSTRCRGPERVALGSSFELIFRCVNTGNLALSNVTFAARGSDGLALNDDGKPERTIERFESGTMETLRVTCTATKVGSHEVTASTREERGWAAAGVVLTIVVQEDPVAAEGTSIGRRYAMSATLEPLNPIEPGKVFRTRTTFRNSGDLELKDVRLGWKGHGGVTLVDESKLPLWLDSMPAGSERTFLVEAKAPKHPHESSRVATSLRDRKGWAAAGALISLPHDE